jgi:hypothetical protein
VLAEQGPLLAAHCRFELPPNSHPTSHRADHSIRLENVTSVRFLECEFSSEGRPAVEWAANPVSSDTAVHLRLHGCTLLGSLAVTGRRETPLRIELERNTFSDRTLFLLNARDPMHPLEVNARRNLLAGESLVRAVGPAGRSSLDPLLRWTGRSNVYALRGDYTDTSPPVRTHDDWLASGATDAADSVAVPLGIQDRLNDFTNPDRAALTAALTLTADERTALAAAGWDASMQPGADPQRTGPGPAYHQWRSSSDYAAWVQQVEAAMNQR